MKSEFCKLLDTFTVDTPTHVIFAHIHRRRAEISESLLPYGKFGSDDINLASADELFDLLIIRGFYAVLSDAHAWMDYDAREVRSDETDTLFLRYNWIAKEDDADPHDAYGWGYWLARTVMFGPRAAENHASYEAIKGSMDSRAAA